MNVIAKSLVGVVALLHVGFFVYESFFWADAATRVVMVNQGVYNGFLAAGLAWGLLREKRDVVAFFLACVVVAGVVGGVTAKPVILVMQGVPAVLAMAALWAQPVPQSS